MKTKSRLGLAGIVLTGAASLFSAGCVMTANSPSEALDAFFGVEKEEPVKKQWIEIDGRNGFINNQGYGIVPISTSQGKSVYAYEYANGRWQSITHCVRMFNSDTYEVYLRNEQEQNRNKGLTAEELKAKRMAEMKAKALYEAKHKH